jgi:hypothetical protein
MIPKTCRRPSGKLYVKHSRLLLHPLTLLRQLTEMVVDDRSTSHPLRPRFDDLPPVAMTSHSLDWIFVVFAVICSSVMGGSRRNE